MSERVTTGVPGFDTLISGGLVRGGSCVIGGNPGTGKTVLANQDRLPSRGQPTTRAGRNVLSESVSRRLGHLSSLSFFNGIRSGSAADMSGIRATRERRRTRSHTRRAVNDRATLLVVDGLETILIVPARGRQSFMHSLEVATEHLACRAILLVSSNLFLQSAGAAVDGLSEHSGSARHRVVRSEIQGDCGPWAGTCSTSVRTA